MNRLDLLKKLTLASGISGFENEISKIMIDELGKFTEYEKDNLGTITFEFKGKSERPKILLIAHTDEIGFMVAYILESGFIKIQPIGSWDVNTLSSSPVEVINSKKERIPGIIGSVPVHFLKDKNAKIKMENLFIDVGAKSKKDLIENFGINLGDQIIPVTNFHYSKQNNLIFSKAFDDRVGVAAVIETGKLLNKINHSNTVLCTGSVQEEVGGRGAKSVANHSDTDICIVLEGAPADDTPDLTENSQTKLGKGVQIRLYDPTMIVKEGIKNFVLKTAEKYKIPHQVTVKKSGGTDGMHIHTANYGIPAIVLAVPVRYAHSHNCMISLDDFDSLVELLQKITEEFDEKALEDINR